MEQFSFANSARKTLARYIVPAGRMGELFVSAGDALDSPDRLQSLELVVLQRTFSAMAQDIAETYRPRSPLEAQLEYDRARNAMAEEGVDIPEWAAAKDPVVLERWAEWSQSED